MYSLRPYKIFCSAFFAALVLSGCKVNEIIKEPVIEPVSISIDVDWKNITKDAPVPTDYTVWLYSNGAPIVMTSSGEQSKAINLEPGSYKVIVYNDDLQTIKRRGTEAYETFEGYLERKELVKTAKSPFYTKSGRVIDDYVEQSDYLHLLTGASNRTIDIVAGKPLDVTLYPRTASKSYKFTISVKSPHVIVDGRAVLSGVATSINFATAALISDNASNIVFPLNVTDNKAIGNVEVLGVDPTLMGMEGSNVVEFELNYEDKTLPPITGEFDISNEIISNPESNFNVDVVVDPEAPKDSQIKVTVEPWVEEETVDIVIKPRS